MMIMLVPLCVQVTFGGKNDTDRQRHGDTKGH